MSDRQILISAVNRIKGLRTEEKSILLKAVTGSYMFRKLTAFDVEWITGARLRNRSDFSSERLWKEGEQEVALWLRSPAVGRTFIGDDDYPADLREIYNPPFYLYYRGSLPAANQRPVAVVGTRRPTQDALRAVYRFSLELGLNDIPAVSGLALGIDAAAHEGNMAGGGKTIVVLGCGVDRIYPIAHRRLAREILHSGGVLFSEYPPGTPPRKYTFPQRNRLISGLCRKVVIAQAPARSGALITADFALDQGRDCYVLKQGLEGPVAEGSRKLADDGAGIVSTVADLYTQHAFSFKDVREEPWPSSVREWAESLQRELDGELFQGYGGRFGQNR